jgi:hypothetical protein
MRKEHLHTDGKVMDGLKSFVRELKKQAGFADGYGREEQKARFTRVSDDDVLEQVRVCGAARHYLFDRAVQVWHLIRLY